MSGSTLVQPLTLPPINIASVGGYLEDQPPCQVPWQSGRKVTFAGLRDCSPQVFNVFTFPSCDLGIRGIGVTCSLEVAVKIGCSSLGTL